MALGFSSGPSGPPPVLNPPAYFCGLSNPLHPTRLARVLDNFSGHDTRVFQGATSLRRGPLPAYRQLDMCPAHLPQSSRSKSILCQSVTEKRAKVDSARCGDIEES